MGKRRFDVMGVLDATGGGFTVGAISVTDAATAIPTTAIDNRKSIVIKNFDASNTVYIGGSNVTVATGFPILPYETISFDMASGGQLYGIAATGVTISVRYLEIDNT